jgi:hypothetical protein
MEGESQDVGVVADLVEQKLGGKSSPGCRHSSPRKGSRGSGISPHRFKYEQRNGGNHKVHGGRKREYPIPMTAKVLEEAT